MNEIQAKLLAAFQVEHREYLDGMRALLGKVEKGGATAAELDEVFRLAHSLRAAARACDFRTVEKVGHSLEAVFARLRKGDLAPARGVFDAVKLALNAIEDWALRLGGDSSPSEPASALQALERVLADGAPGKAKVEADDLNAKLMAAFQIEHREHLEGIRAILAEIEQGKPAQGDNIDEAFRRAHSLKGAARLAELHPAEALAHRLETLFARVREGTLTLDPKCLRVIHQGLDAIEDWASGLSEKRRPADQGQVLAAIEGVLGGQSEEEFVPAQPREEEPAPALAEEASAPRFQAVETVRVSADNLDRLLRSTGQLLTESLRQNLVARELSGINRQLAALEKEWEQVRNGAGRALRELGDTPGMARIARYLGLMERQVRALSRQSRAVRLLHQRSSWTLRLLGGQLQQDVRRVRTVSAESVFQGFRKMMRDLARDEGKQVDFRVSGLEIEADRMVLQALKDPLMHTLCNAVTHGIEPPAERHRQGKNPVGLVSLRLETVGNRLKILVEDDGRGIDHAQVAEVAVRRGFASAEEAAAATPEELARLIFKPGFSTSHTVTGLSGRGMGLSVVYEGVARLQGEVHLQPREGPGTSFLLAVPLSVSAQRLLLVSCRGQTFAIPVHAIEQLLQVKVQDIETVEGRPMLLLQGQPIPLLSLAGLLQMNEAGVSAGGGLVPLLILRSGTKRVAVAVDAFLAERDGLIKDLDDPAARLSKLSGGILLEDSSVALVLNPAELVLNSRPGDRAAPLQTVVPVPEKKASTILVVDDSLTTRTLEKTILEAHGYIVRIAMDGLEALDQLRAEPADLVITDLQMPRMDGFALLEAMKKDQRLAQVPVIVVTSMGRREDQERGLALGADAYIVKRKFDHQDLLATIRQII